MAGYNHIATVYPYPHIPSRHEKCITVMAVLATELPIDPDSLAHSNLSCNIDVTIATFRMCTKFMPCLFEQDLNALPGDPFGCRVAGLLLHFLVVLLLDVVNYLRTEYKRNGDFTIPAESTWIKKSDNPDNSSISHQSFFTEKPDRFRETFMLISKNPLCQ